MGLDKLSPDHQGGSVRVSSSSQDESSPRMTPASPETAPAVNCKKLLHCNLL